eukprot:9901535-Heterocapsa_arctica.AAC.1
MHPIVQQVGQIKTYTRRNDLQQAEHPKQDKHKKADSHTQTFLGEDQNNNGKTKEAEEKAPKEDKSKMGDYEASKDHNQTNKQKKGIIFNEEKVEGIRITSINLSESQLDV